jgi:hypothetical protein
MNPEALLEKERTKHLAVNFRTDRVYNAGLIASIENDERKAECYFCGYIDNQIHLDIHENGTIRSILSAGSMGKPTIIEMADCAIELGYEVRSNYNSTGVFDFTYNMWCCYKKITRR